jgi:hypothetical protein
VAESFVAPPRNRRAPWLIVVFGLVGLVITYGGFSVYRDQHSGTPGTAKVTECQGGTGKYDRGIHCRGTWEVGGDAIFGDGELALGRIEGADKGDVGKTIAVRIHGTDHATVPALGTPIVLWALGVPISLLCLWGLLRWWRRGR